MQFFLDSTILLIVLMLEVYLDLIQYLVSPVLIFLGSLDSEPPVPFLGFLFCL